MTALALGLLLFSAPHVPGHAGCLHAPLTAQAALDWHATPLAQSQLVAALEGYTAPMTASADPVRVLVFSKTAGFRHDSIPEGIAALKKAAPQAGLNLDFTEDSARFTAESLKPFHVILFLNTTGDILNEDQQAAMEAFIRSGKGFVGIHSATDTEYGWPWYMRLVGAAFAGHPPGLHTADVVVEDRTHPTTKHLPARWSWHDEWYNFRENPRSKVHVLATVDESTYTGGTMGADHPIMWCHEFEGGRAWYTAQGHAKETYSDPLFMKAIVEGIRWSAEAKAENL